MRFVADGFPAFQSPRGDFGFLKVFEFEVDDEELPYPVSIPSRGFWFFEVVKNLPATNPGKPRFQSPRGDFGFLKLPPLPLASRS